MISAGVEVECISAAPCTRIGPCDMEDLAPRPTSLPRAFRRAHAPYKLRLAGFQPRERKMCQRDFLIRLHLPAFIQARDGLVRQYGETRVRSRARVQQPG